MLRPWYLAEAALVISIVGMSTLGLAGAHFPLGLPSGAITAVTFGQFVAWLVGAVLVLRWYLALDAQSVAARLRVARLMTALLALVLVGQIVRLAAG